MAAPLEYLHQEIWKLRTIDRSPDDEARLQRLKWRYNQTRYRLPLQLRAARDKLARLRADNDPRKMYLRPRQIRATRAKIARLEQAIYGA